MFAQEIIGVVDGQDYLVFMSYEESDPWAVTFAFPEGNTFVEWTFGRELLAEAIDTGKSGMGDIRLATDGDSIVLSLLPTRREDTGITLAFPKDEVVTFWEHTERIVPAGSESIGDVDREWQTYLDEV